LIRPLFLTPDGKSPGPYKRYYDIFTVVLTQVTMSFVVIPFQFLTLPDSIKVWARVYFYGVIGTAACFAFLQSPGKAMLVKRAKARSRPALERTPSQGSVADGDMQSTLGLPHDPEFEMQQIMKGVKEEIETRKRRGSTVPDIRVLLQQKLDEFKRDQQVGRQIPVGVEYDGSAVKKTK
jgi:lysophospholipid acyltransferase